VYGLGAVLYALLAGKAPFGGDSVVETLDAVRTRPPVPPSRLNATVPRDLEVICLKSLEKDPARRYHSAATLAEDLRSWLDGRPLTARPVSSAVRTWMWCRRHPVPAGLTAALILAVLAGSIASTVLWLRAERNYRNEQQARADAQARLGLALEAIRTYYTGVSEDVLLKEPQMKSLRDKLLKTALDFYKRLQESLQSNPDAKAQADLAEAYYRVGQLTALLGLGDDAKQAHQRALVIRERLAAAYPTNDDYQRDLAASLRAAAEPRRALAIRERLAAAHRDDLRYQIDLAESLTDNLNPEASFSDNKAIVAELRRNGQRLEALVAAYPSVPEIRGNLAVLYFRLAAFLGNELDIEGRLRSYQRGREVLEQIANAPNDPYLSLLRQIYWGMGEALTILGRPGEALAARRRAVELADQVVTYHPTVRQYRRFLARVLGELGELQLDQGLVGEAEKTLRRSRATLEDLAKLDPGYVGSRDLNTLALGRLEAALGRPAEAIKVLLRILADREEDLVDATSTNAAEPVIQRRVDDYYNACDAYEAVGGPIDSFLHARASLERLEGEGRLKPTARQMQLWLDIRIARAQRRAGRLDEARKTIRRVESELDLVRGVGPPSQEPYNTACALALLSDLVGRPGMAPSAAEQAEIRAYRDRAVGELRRALDMGWPRGRLLSDHDLDSLRGRTDFQALVRDLAFPANPFAP
jgi:serine/threonine-protein kinase